MKWQITTILWLPLLMQVIEARKHHLVLTNDNRKLITVSTFGFLTGGSLSVQVDQLGFGTLTQEELSRHDDSDQKFGFTLARTMSDRQIYLDDRQDHCLLDDISQNVDGIGFISMIFNFKQNKIQLNCNDNMRTLRLYEEKKIRKRSPIKAQNSSKSKTDEVLRSDDHLDQNKANKQPVEVDKKMDESEVKDNEIKKVDSKDDNPEKSDNLIEGAGQLENRDSAVDSSCQFLQSIKLVHKVENGNQLYSFRFVAVVVEEQHQGLYSFFLHNCLNTNSYKSAPINLSMYITEKNLDNYLSAGEIPLPQLYFALSVIFFLLGAIWVHVIRHKKEDTFRIHYLMAALVFFKASSLLFHGINYHFIAKEGSQVETWAVLYYITHLLKGALLFITIVLIGTGWAFIKHILSEKDKKIFMIVIPLQVLANIADIIYEESEEGETKHIMWREIFILVDLLCCGAILFPVVWSIRHLQEASQTDGKAAINLKKLELFRHFYVMIVCYIYFTRIIVYLLKISVPFQYEWLDVFFQHAATLLFFIFTGYYFQPTPSNPYFQLTQDDDLEMEEVLFVQPSAFSDTKKRLGNVKQGDTIQSGGITKRESSHDFD